MVEEKESKRWLNVFLSFIKLLRIDSKEVDATDGRGSELNLWKSQEIFLKELCKGLDKGIRTFYCLKARQLGVCLDPNTKVLTADLRWICIEELEPGVEVVAVDESLPGGIGQHRKMRTGVVQAVVKVQREAYRIVFDDGREVICTGQHPWLSRKSNSETSWRSIENRKGLSGRLKIGTQIRWITKPWGKPSVEDGWFGGMLDGEGSFSKASRGGAQVCVCQLKGPVLDRLIKYVEENKYTYRVEDDESIRLTKYGKAPCPKIALTRMSEIFRLIGQTRPTRFIGRKFWEGKELPGKRIANGAVGWATIVKIEKLDTRTMIDLQTTTGTYIAEGFVSHNTTISLAIDTFWLAMHPGTIGALVTDTEANREANRALIKRYIDSFPKGFFGKSFIIEKDNRNFMMFSNGSRLDFLVAGTRTKKTWGEGRGYVFCHATEVASYGSKEGLDSFIEALAETHPNRLFIFESTAKGFNFWREMWIDAGRDTLTKKKIFIGWWSKDLNKIDKKDRRYALYGTAEPEQEEQELIDNVKELYGFHVTREQLAWYRWRVSDESKDMQTNYQNLPWTEAQAFIMSGFSFFSVRTLQKEFGEIKNPEAPITFRGYKYVLGNDFHSGVMEPIQKQEQINEVELRVWEDPIETAQYVIGVDPAWGRNDWKDRHCVSVWRAFADHLIQVAEYADNNTENRQAAWVLAHLAGSYRNSMVNIELTGGPGRAIMTELDHLRQRMQSEMYREQAKQDYDWDDFLRNARWYLYHKCDSAGGGYPKGWETHGGNKWEIMLQLKDAHNTGQLIIRSAPLIEEMLTVVQDGSEIGAPGKGKDDRVLGAALATRAWIDWVRPAMIANGETMEMVLQREESGEEQRGEPFVDQIVRRYMKAQEEYEPEPTPKERWLQDRGFI